MTERMIEQGIETVKAEGLPRAVIEIREEDGVTDTEAQERTEQLVARGLEEGLFSEEAQRQLRREEVLARVALQRKQRDRKKRPLRNFPRY